LGGAVCLGIYKIATSSGEFGTLSSYINTTKASEIVSSILLSVIISFTIGAFVMYFSRLIFSFHFEKRVKYLGAIIGGFAITAITYFILFKGIKGSSFMTSELKELMKTNQMYIVLGSFIFWTIFSQILIALKKNIFKVIIIIGTFGLALAFAGNDLVNF